MASDTEFTNMRDATPGQIRAVQLKSLEILAYFTGFCSRFGLVFFVAGGCCIGAVRHKGFVPWDDDVDVFMLRGDYEKLSLLHPVHGDPRFRLCRTDASHNYHHSDTAIVDTSTTFINSHSKDLEIPHGVALDVIPLDGCAPGAFSRQRQIFSGMVYSLYNVQRLPDHQGGAVRAASAVLLGAVPFAGARRALWSGAEKSMTRWDAASSPYLTELVTGMRYIRNRYPAEWFSSQHWMQFEDTRVPVPRGYDGYLKAAFGDYMTPPPPESRHPKHDTVHVNLNEPYAEYLKNRGQREGGTN